LGNLPPKSSIPKNFRTEAIEFKLEIVDYSTVKSTDESLTGKEADQFFFDFIDFLLENTVFNIAEKVLNFV